MIGPQGVPEVARQDAALERSNMSRHSSTIAGRWRTHALNYLRSANRIATVITRRRPVKQASAQLGPPTQTMTRLS